jgi:hypothetical protein
MVHDNVFFKIGRSAIEFNNARNEADGNVYPEAASPFGGAPYLRVKFPEPAEWHNLESWREEHGWDMNGALAEIRSSAPAASILSRTPLTLCELKLSITTKSPGRSCGHRT